MPIEFKKRFEEVAMRMAALGKDPVSPYDVAWHTGIPRTSLNVWIGGGPYTAKNIYADLKLIEEHLRYCEIIYSRARTAVNWKDREAIRRAIQEIKREEANPQPPSAEDWSLMNAVVCGETTESICGRLGITLHELGLRLSMANSRFDHGISYLARARADQAALMGLREQESERLRQSAALRETDGTGERLKEETKCWTEE
jgi:hypothetical protein